MRRTLWYLMLLIVTVLPSSGWSEVVEGVAAVVDGEIITLSDVDHNIANYGNPSLPPADNPLAEEMRRQTFRQATVEKMVEDMILQRTAVRAGIKVTPEEIQGGIARIKKESGLTDAQFGRELTAAGFTEKSYGEFLAGRIRKSKVVDSFIKPKVSLDEGMLVAFYEKHQDDFRGPPQLRVSHVFAALPNDAAPQTAAMAEEKVARVLERLREGSPFEDVAMLYSEDASSRFGGDLGFFKKGEMNPALWAVAADLEVGEVSDVVRSPMGLHVLKVTERKEGVLIPFDEVKDAVRERYYRSEVDRFYSEWLREMKEHYNVEIKL